MGEFSLHFAEKDLELEENEIKEIEPFLEYLKGKESIEWTGNSIKFINFTGIFKISTKNFLVIPEKLYKHFGLEDNNFFEKYNKKFEKFLKYILKELSKENILYTLSLSDFSVKENKINESKIFKLLLLLEKKDELINSLYLILSNPHRKLIEEEIYKTVDEVSYIDSDIIVDIIQNPQRLQEVENGIISYENKEYMPTLVLQHKIEESFDTLENRFVKYFLKELEFVLDNELKEFMFLEELKQIKNEVEYFINSDILSEVGDLNYFPSNSQVLMKKSGYRELFQIFRLFHLSFVPKIFQDLDIAFYLKDMATLWEYYVLIKLLKNLKNKFGNYQTIVDFKEKAKYRNLYEFAEFKFKNGAKFYFQKTEKAYSGLELRPDFLLIYEGKKYIFDAKFRIFEDNKQDLLKNMHYYKDGLNSVFSIAICLGLEDKEKGKFYFKSDRNTEEYENLSEILNESFNGIGYFDLNIIKDNLK